MPRRKPKIRKTPQPNSQPLVPSFVLRYDRVQVAESSFRHGVSEVDIRHAQNQAIRIFEYFDESDRQRILVVGPDRSGNLLELIATICSDQTMRIFHAMKLRPKFEVLITERKDE